MTERMARAEEQGATEPPEPAVAPAAGEHSDSPTQALLEAWAPVDAEIRQMVEDSAYRIWLSPASSGRVHPHARLGGVWLVGVDPRALSWVRDRFGRLYEAAAGRPVTFVPCGERPASQSDEPASAPDL